MTKPNRFGQALAGKFAHWGQGSQVSGVPKKIPVTYADFRGGYNSAYGDEQGDNNSSPNCQDVIVSKSNRLARMPGGTRLGSFAFDALMTELVIHQSLQNVGELLFLGPPFLGVLSSSGFTLTDLSLPTSTELFRWALYGETLILSNGKKGVYLREPGQVGLTLTNKIPIGKSYGVLSSRLFVGGAFLDGDYQPMGIAWNSSAVDPEDFLGEGAGSEILLADASHGDEIVAIRMMNLDLMGILCKQSIWIGRRTQDPFRPAAFEPRIMGDGGIHDRACVVTPIGMTYLSETGLRTFDGNSSILLSPQINNDLLPLDFDKINDYRVNYDYKRNWIYLHTPICTWIYDIEYQRWYKMAVPGVLDMVIWKDQLGGVTWAQLQAQGKTWNDLNDSSWFDLGRRESGWGTPYFLQRSDDGSFYWKEDKTKLTWPTTIPTIVVPQYPRWEFRHHEAEEDNTIVTVDGVIIKYAGSGDIRVSLPDNEGNPLKIFRQTLPAALGGELRAVQVNMIWSGKGVTATLELVSGDLEIAKFQLMAQVRSTNPSRPGSDLQEYIGFWDKP